MPTAGPKSPSTSFKQRAICCSLWLPYTFALFFIWGFIFDVQAGWERDPDVHHSLRSWIQEQSELLIIAAVTLIGPLIISYAVRFLFIYFATGRRLWRREDRCPHCNYIVPVVGNHTCPECGKSSTFAQRATPSPALKALSDITWFRRFTFACIVGFVGGPALAMFENGVVQHYAVRAFATTPPTSPSTPKANFLDYSPHWIDPEYVYTEHTGGRLYWTPGYWRHLDRYEDREPQIFKPSFRITPWFALGDKFAQPSGRVFVDYD